MNQTICTAINKRRLLRFYYIPGWRTVEPHAHGESTQGHDLLRAFQTEGASASGEHVNRKLFRVDLLSNLELLEETFSAPRPEYRRDNKQMARIYCQL